VEVQRGATRREHDIGERESFQPPTPDARRVRRGGSVEHSQHVVALVLHCAAWVSTSQKQNSCTQKLTLDFSICTNPVSILRVPIQPVR
jgi:hypothetical protein